MTQTEALKLALEALEDNQHLVADNERHAYVMEYNDLIEKCKEALAQPEQEPVIGTKTWFEDGKVVTQHLTAKDIYKDPEQPEQEPATKEQIREAMIFNLPLYTMPPHPDQEPVAWLGFNERGECREVFTRDMKKTLPNYPTEGMTPVYTTPPQRTWVGLDWNEMPEIYMNDKAFEHGAQWAESKLKEKNFDR